MESFKDRDKKRLHKNVNQRFFSKNTDLLNNHLIFYR